MEYLGMQELPSWQRTEELLSDMKDEWRGQNIQGLEHQLR
jgi:hypothetical protein